MKKILLFVLIAGLMAPLAGFSQLDKGDLMNPFSAGLSYYHRNLEESAINDVSFTLSDGLGIFVIDRLAVGPGLTFSLENYRWKDKENPDNNYLNQFSYNILFSPFARYYFAHNGKLAFFAQLTGNIGFAHNKNKSVDPDMTETESTYATLTYGGAAGIGMTYFFNDNIGLETQLQYSFDAEDAKYKSSSYDTDNNSTIGKVMLNVGLNFYIQP